jgi:Flp pilus assembly pilin Flp
MVAEALMPQWLRGFCREEDGQDLIEYSLVITFIAIACLAMIGAIRPAVGNIWTAGNTKLANAAAVSSGS